MTSVHEALSVLGRTAGWLARDGNVVRARYVEANLSRWAVPEAAEPPLADGFRRIQEALSGFDNEPPERREARLRSLIDALDAVRRIAGEAPEAAPEPRAVLLPEGVAAEKILRPPPPPEVAPPPVPAEPAEARVEGERAREERVREPREGREGREPREGREREGREARGREGREGRRRDRDERRRDRDERREGREGREREPEGREAEAPAVEVAPPAPEAPAAPPEPRTFPLGHPEASGEALEALGLPADEVDAWNAAGVATGAELLLRAPLAVDRAGERWIPGVTPEGAVIVRGTVRRRVTRFAPGVRRYEVLVGSDKGDVACRWLGDVADEIRALRPGADVGLAGRLELEDDVPVLYEGEILGMDGRGGDWLPRYGIPGVSEPRARTAVRAALRKYAESLQDHLPPEVVERYKLMPLAQAVRDAHFPSNAARKGRSRLGFDELLQVQLGVALLRQRERRDRGVANPVSHALVAQAHGMLGWQFTDEQELAFDDIRRDLRKNQPMARLLQGDVGAGKHAVVQAAMVVVGEARHQALFIAPDAVSAEHRYLFAEGFFKSVGIEPMLLTGTPTRAQAEALRKGEAMVVYATPAVLKDPPAFRKLGLVVFEEQGPYGLADVGPFEAQGQRPDMLVFTPTPVPSAIALNIYGNLAMTVMPPAPARGVDTTAYDAGTREEAYAIARQAIEDGQQVMLVFPMLRGHDLLSPSEARRLAEVLGTETFPGARIGIFNGGMSREERFRAYDDFQHRRSDVLLATTFVEHGPVVPGAAVLIVEQAQQYDLVRLHRLRGHVAYGWKRGKCLLVIGDDPRPEARHNIDLLLKESDGFRIAELDLRHRGLDAVLGERALDAPDFAWADPVQERDLFVKTRQEAVRLLSIDPGLKRRTHRALLYLVRARFGEEVVTSEAAPVGAPQAEGQAGGRRRRRRRGR